jgi:integrase/recombinase XerD
MLNAVETYLALRRATGFAMSNAEYLLKSFAAFAAERGQTHVQMQTAIDWAALGPSVAQRDARLKALWRFVRVQVEDARHELPPASHFGARKRRRTPHIYSADEINRLVEAALRLRPNGGLRPLTYATLIALLSAAGLRISEALKLTVADVTGDGLLIRETKFRKTRLVPLHDTAAAGLELYLAHSRPRSQDDDPVFIDKRGLPLRYIAVKETFDRLVGKAGIRSRTAHRPRLHDLRHTFAVRVLQSSPAGRSRCGSHMVALATYMGHVNITATYWYLEATADLMRDIAAAGEGFLSEGGSS